MAQCLSLLLSVSDQAASEEVPWAHVGNPFLAVVSLGRIIYLPIPALWHGQDEGKRVAILSHLYKP